MYHITRNEKNQAGQTLIETLAAIFILVTTLTVGLGLSVYVLSTARTSADEVVATNLARQAIEVVRMARDSNWLASDAKNSAGYGLATCSDVADAMCYAKAYDAVSGNPSYSNNFNLTTPNQAVCNTSSTNCSLAGDVRLLLSDGATFAQWPTANMFEVNLTGAYNLYLQPNGHYYYNPAFVGDSATYARKVKLSRINVAPFTNQNSNWEIIVNVYVAWSAKNCPSVQNQDPETLATTCKVVLEDHLTNWKDYR